MEKQLSTDVEYIVVSSHIRIGNDCPVFRIYFAAGQVGRPVTECSVSRDGVVARGEDSEVLADAIRTVSVAAAHEEKAGQVGAVHLIVLLVGAIKIALAV